MKKPPAPHYSYVDPPHVRRRFAAELRKLAGDASRFTDEERAEFRRNAEAWEATLQTPPEAKKES